MSPIRPATLLAAHQGDVVAVLPHEGTYNILFHSYAIPVGSGFRSGYLARPDQVGRFPAVVILPGIFGLRSFEKDLARQLARHGFVAISFDPYPSPLTSDATLDEAVSAYSALDDRRALTDIDRAIDFAIEGASDFTVGGPVGMVGVDTGGRFGLLYAADRHRLAGLVAIHAPLAGDEQRMLTVRDALERILIPVLGLYGANDEHIPSEGVDVAADLNPSGQWIVYEAAGHGFMDPDSDLFQSGAASDASSRIPKFLSARLPQPEPSDY